MKQSATAKSQTAGFTLIELLVVVAVIFILVAVFYHPHRGQSKTKARLVMCLSNLRVAGVAYTHWAEANGNLFPWQVSTNAGGTLESGATGTAAGHFVPLGKFFADPGYLTCPTDRLRVRTNSYVGFNNTNLSYFISLDASPGAPAPALLILAGDRELSVAGQPVAPGPLVVTNGALLEWKWAHSGRGVLAFVDGHAEARKTDTLPAAFQRQAIATNLLVIP